MAGDGYFNTTLPQFSSAIQLPIPLDSSITYINVVRVGDKPIKFDDNQTLAPNNKITLASKLEFSLLGDGFSLVVVPVATTPVSQQPSTPASTTPAPGSLPLTTPVTSTASDISSIPLSVTSSGNSTTGGASSKPEVPVPTKSVSPGAAAGIAIGCLVGGALLAGLLVWFCLRKSRQKRADRHQEASSVALIHGEKGLAPKPLSLGSGSPVSNVGESGLPQPLEDKAISGEVSKISNSIKNHVQSFYYNGRISPGLLDLDDLQALGDDLPISTGTLSTLLGNSDTREIALRFCIAWVVVTRMQLRSGINTLLPREVADCFQSMAFIDRSSRVQTHFFAKWRALTAELMQSTYARNAFSTSDSRNHNIEAALRVLDPILLLYTDSRMDKNQRRRNLEEILKRAATFAFTLFSQPSSWDFDWKDQQGVMSGSLCVFPALVQVVDEAGEPVKPPRAFSEAVVRRLDD